MLLKKIQQYDIEWHTWNHDKNIKNSWKKCWYFCEIVVVNGAALGPPRDAGVAAAGTTGTGGKG
jgi:hypothetical protein